MRLFLLQVVFILLSMFQGVPAPAYVCQGACQIPFTESCDTVISDYNFSGTCCSLADNTTTRGCELTISGTTATRTAYCNYVLKNHTTTCPPNASSCVDQDYYIQSTAMESCPLDKYNVLGHASPSPSPAMTHVPTASGTNNKTQAPGSGGGSNEKTTVPTASSHRILRITVWSWIVLSGIALVF